VSVTSLIVIIRRIFFIKEDVFDQKVFDFLAPYVTDANTAVMLFFTFFGSYYFMVPAWLLVFSYYFFIRKNKGYFNRMVTIAVSNLLLLWTLKFFFNRPRPLIPLLKEIPGLSFPSGHAFMGMIFYGLFICIAYRDIKKQWKRWTVICILFTFLILVGFSRVYLRVHYFSDIIAGYCFGIISLTILFWLLKRIEKFNKGKMTLSADGTVPVSKTY
jgi:undecaprenyl-diphosphatase